jgi:hypothetical protein
MFLYKRMSLINSANLKITVQDVIENAVEHLWSEYLYTACVNQAA